jgi:hypothetical protein
MKSDRALAKRFGLRPRRPDHTPEKRIRWNVPPIAVPAFLAVVFVLYVMWLG